MTSSPSSLLAAARAIQPSIVADRRDIHQHPELAYTEERTASKVAERLRSLGIDVRTGVGKTGVVGLLEGGRPGKTVLLRADMDALPILEQTEVPFVSQNPGIMHACGHDGHTAMLLGAAQLLAERRAELPGRVKLMFQPAEEGGAGALRMIEDGLLQGPDVDAAFALHVAGGFTRGRVAVKPGPVFASSDRFIIRIKGRGGHASRPEETVDPVVVAAHIITMLQSIVAREISPREQAVITVGTLQAGTAMNIIPDTAELRGTARSYSNDVQALIERRIGEIAKGVAQAMRGDAETEYIRLYPPVINHEAGAALVRAAIDETLGADAAARDVAAMGGEDFAFLLQRVPGAMFRLGVRHPSWSESRNTHTASFDLDEDALPIGTAVLASSAIRFLEKGM